MEKDRKIRVRCEMEVDLSCTWEELNELLSSGPNDWGNMNACILNLVDPGRRKQAMLLDADCHVISWKEVV